MNDPASPAQASSDTRCATIEMAVAGRKIRLEVSAPVGPTRVVDLLPLVNSLVDSFAAITVEKSEESGGKISCKKGCAACCRQLIPMTEFEARRISELVDGMPEPRRSEMVARFEAARKKVQDAGLERELLETEANGRAEHLALALKYFRFGIACPFLENEMCSIYSDRPIPCREYLVTTPAENCRELKPGTVKSIRCQENFASIISRVAEDPATPRRTQIPLIFAREWAADHPDEPPTRPGTELLREFFHYLTEKEIPETEEPGEGG